MAKKWVRHSIQTVATLLQNANFKGFFEGRIYQGPSKSVCVPGLNCYSCPGAIGACPIGSLQSYLSDLKFKVPYYVVGILIFVGALIGRAVCGFLCPFGLLQDLLDKIPFFKKNSFKLDKYLRYFKYAVLGVFVLLLPFCFKLTPFFCKYICPSGTVAGLWLAALDKQIAGQLGGLFSLKLVILGLILPRASSSTARSANTSAPSARSTASSIRSPCTACILIRAGAPAAKPAPAPAR